MALVAGLRLSGAQAAQGAVQGLLQRRGVRRNAAESKRPGGGKGTETSLQALAPTGGGATVINRVPRGAFG